VTAVTSFTMPEAGGVIEKARGKVALESGYSLMSWMRLSQSGNDLTGGVGVVDEDEPESSWPEWTLDEVKKHNTSEDAWMALRGKVYNITPYLKYHPGGVNTLLKAAGTDGTALFDKFHAWVNAHGIMEACCVGRLASAAATASSASHADAVDVADAARSSPPSPPPATGTGDPAASDTASDSGRRQRSVVWDEEGIAAHDAERGVRFGTMKVDHVGTPYMFLDEEAGSVAIHSKYLPDVVPYALQPDAPGPYTLPVGELRHALGLLETDAHGTVNLPRPKWSHTEEFGRQVHELYSGEGRVAALSKELPDGWTVFISRSEPCEPFYFHLETNLTQWERPV